MNKRKTWMKLALNKDRNVHKIELNQRNTFTMKGASEHIFKPYPPAIRVIRRRGSVNVKSDECDKATSPIRTIEQTVDETSEIVKEYQQIGIKNQTRKIKRRKFVPVRKQSEQAIKNTRFSFHRRNSTYTCRQIFDFQTILDAANGTFTISNKHHLK